MDRPSGDVHGRHISQIETLWPVLMKALEAPSPEMAAAQEVILKRYRPAIYRYLLACLGNADAADEVYQDFALKFVQGDFRKANPEKGRFRDLLKTALYHLIIDHHKRRQNGMPQLSPDGPEPADSIQSVYESDKQFLDSWRTALLNKAWDALAEEERQTGRLMHTVLHFRAGHQDMKAAQMAEALSLQLGKEVSADWVRKWLHIAREKFARFLLQEVAASLRDPTPDALEEELIDLKLHDYCKTALASWREELKPPANFD